MPLCSLAALSNPADTIILGDVGTADDFLTPLPDRLKLGAPTWPLDDDDDARAAARPLERKSISFMDGYQRSLLLTQFYLNQNHPNRWFTR